MAILVWDFPTRVFHWLLAASFAGAWLTAESEWLRDIHVALGYTMAGLILFRLVWGVVGTRYARFSSLTLRPAKVLAYLRSLLTSRPEHHVGHNPAGAVAVVLMLVAAAAAVLTGILDYEGIGPGWIAELHEAAAGAIAALAGVHIAGVAVSSLLHRENLVRAMITGYKRGAPHARIRHAHALVATALVVVIASGWIWQYNAAPDPAGLSSTGEAGAKPVAGWRLAWHGDERDED